MARWRSLILDGLAPDILTLDCEDIYYHDLLVGLGDLPRQQRNAFQLVLLMGYTEEAARAILLPNSSSATPVGQYSMAALKRMVAAYDACQHGERIQSDFDFDGLIITPSRTPGREQDDGGEYPWLTKDQWNLREQREMPVHSLEEVYYRGMYGRAHNPLAGKRPTPQKCRAQQEFKSPRWTEDFDGRIPLGGSNESCSYELWFYRDPLWPLTPSAPQRR